MVVDHSSFSCACSHKDAEVSLNFVVRLRGLGPRGLGMSVLLEHRVCPCAVVTRLVFAYCASASV